MHMASRVIVLTGPARSGKTEQMLRRYREALRAGPIGAALWLAPTGRARDAVRDRLLDAELQACFSPGLMTFARFARWVLERSGQHLILVDRPMRRRLLGSLIEEWAAAGRLKHFAAVARSGGLVDLLEPWIGELKRLEIWPDDLRKACSARGLFDRDREALGLYEAYQEALFNHGLYDEEGSFWSARTLLREHGPRLLGKLRLAVVDGFTDFTCTQHEILELLALHVEELIVTLPLEGEPQRSDLFAKSLGTLAELRRRSPNVEEHTTARRAAPAWPAMDHLERNLFQPPGRAAPLADAAGLEILAAAREAGQIERIGAIIKRLLAEGDGPRPVAPQEIAVVFRNVDEAAPLVREVFGRLGIPFALESLPRLAAAPGLRRLLAALRLDADDWPFRGLLALLSGNHFRPAWAEWNAGQVLKAVDRSIRERQMPRGRAALLAALQRQRDVVIRQLQTTAAGEPERQRLRDERDRLTQALALLDRLAGALDALPQQAGLAEWGLAWGRLADELGLFDAPPAVDVARDPLANPSPAVRDDLAWTKLGETLAAGDRLFTRLGRPSRPERREALAILADLLSSVSVHESIDESGRVRVLSARSLRTMEMPYLFFAGLTEKSFPAPPHEGRLYGEQEERRLIEGGLPLVDAAGRAREEMLLFYEVATRATRRLWFTYPALDEAGQPLSPSPYLQEVEQACGEGRIVHRRPLDLTPLPPDEEPLSAEAFRVRAVIDALAGNVALLAGLVRDDPPGGTAGLSSSAGNTVGQATRGAHQSTIDGALVRDESAASVADNLLAGLLALDSRSGEAFGPWEGMLDSPAARNALLARFAPDRVFSVTELETYAACPFRFLLERVLKVEPPVELELRPDYRMRGGRAHLLLAELHRRLNEIRGRPTSPAEFEPDEYEAIWRALLAELPDAAALSPLQAALREIDDRTLAVWMEDYRRQHAEYDKQCEKEGQPLRPALFEVSFGGPPDAENPHSVGQPLELCDGERRLRISGRIDRLDLGQAGSDVVFNVLDYKLGGSTQFSVESAARGLTLQLPLYALAGEQLLLAQQGARAWRAGYWHVADNGYRPRKAFHFHEQEAGRLRPTPEWSALRETLVQTVFALVRGMLQGAYPVYNPDLECTGACPLRTVCRINMVRSLEKLWAPPPNAD